MPNWLAPTYNGTPFILFGMAHLAALALTLSVCFLLAWFSRQPAATPPRKTAMRYVLVGMLLGTQIVWDIWQISVGVWVVSWSLPLHLCQLTQLLSAVMLLTRSSRLFEILYFWSVVGATQALLTPNLTHWGFPHIGFLAFFVSHGATLLAIVFMLSVEGLRPTWGALWRTCLITNLLLPFIMLINWLTGGNYWFVSRAPNTSSLIDYLGPWPWYLISLQAIGIMLFIAALLPFVWRPHLRKVNAPAG
ncbi:MAG: TIGR02206 family membrane protein [Chloroflexales bacterium]|nr:TIGR02206 family membrane protein [Chloroflexales bacterium]